MSVPTISRLSSHYGSQNIIAVVNSIGHAELLEYMVGKNIIIFVRKNSYPLSEVLLFIKLFIRKIDIIFAPHLSNTLINKVFMSLLRKKTIVPMSVRIPRCISWIIPIPFSLSNSSDHQVNFYSKFIGHYDASYDTSPFKTSDLKGIVSFEPRHHLNTNIGSTDGHIRIAIGISCNPKERHKITSPEIIANIFGYLSNQYRYEFYILGTTEDRNVIEKFMNVVSGIHNVQKFISNSIPETLDFLNTCHFGICGTTGQGHMMAVVDLPLLVICGVTNPHESAPYSTRAAIVRHDLPCGPCYQEELSYGCGKIQCMNEINPLVCADMLTRLIVNNQFGLDWLLNTPRLRTKPVKTIRSIVDKIIECSPV